MNYEKLFSYKDNNMFIENFNQYYSFNLLKYPSNKIIIDILINNNYVKFKIPLNKIFKNIKIKFLNLMIGDYNINHIVLLSYFNNITSEYELFTKCILETINNLQLITDKTNFHHGDFKVNNMTINIDNLNDIKSYIYDLEFSIFLEPDNVIFVDNFDDYPLVNRYLNCNDNYKLSGDLLKLFDYYYFAFSLIVNTRKQVKINICLENLIDTTKSHHNLFYLLFLLLKKYISNTIINIDDYEYCKIDNIIKICLKINDLEVDNKFSETKLWINKTIQNIILINAK
jgi:hypothetical protein